MCHHPPHTHLSVTGLFLRSCHELWGHPMREPLIDPEAGRATMEELQEEAGFTRPKRSGPRGGFEKETLDVQCCG